MLSSREARPACVLSGSTASCAAQRETLANARVALSLKEKGSCDLTQGCAKRKQARMRRTLLPAVPGVCAGAAASSGSSGIMAESAAGTRSASLSACAITRRVLDLDGRPLRCNISNAHAGRRVP